MAFLRKQAVMAWSGFNSASSLYDAIKGGRFPPPDAYLGPKTPVWLDTTYYAWEERTVEAARSLPQSDHAIEIPGEAASGPAMVSLNKRLPTKALREKS
jgi:predicted DNA-binding transcriptional regulator AlpA